MPQVPLVHVGDPEPGIGGLAHAWPHIPQFITSVDRFLHPPLVHIVSPGRQALQSFIIALQPFGHGTIMLLHMPVALHSDAVVLIEFVHVCPGPHIVPVGLLPVSAHTDVPVEHDVIPNLHGLVGLHGWPAVHATHAPALHTRFAPHAVPLGCDCPVSMHTAAPVLQLSVPV
jgi:hypothetical protein